MRKNMSLKAEKSVYQEKAVESVEMHITHHSRKELG
jgi:hypothetical protein